MAFNDQTKISFGKHKGTKLANVPASYLLWLHKEGICFGDLKRYIEDNKQVLEEEKKNERFIN